MKKHIFIIDDDAEEIEILSAALACVKEPCNFTHANRPMLALEMLKKTTPDIIFMDYRMPEMNGIECLKKIRDLPQLKKTLAILYSNSLTEEIMEQGMALNVKYCINKPSSFEALIRILNQLVSSLNFTLV